MSDTDYRPRKKSYWWLWVVGILGLLAVFASNARADEDDDEGYQFLRLIYIVEEEDVVLIEV